MSLDRERVDAIKNHFARKSTAQLQAIARGTEADRWSAEAVVAAGEVLRDRLAGLAREPQVPEPDDLPEYHYEPSAAESLGLLAGLFTGSFVISYTRRSERPDLPVPFGRTMAWLAMATTDTAVAASAVGLRGGTPAPWGQGVEAAHNGSVFVTPPLGNWTLAVGTPLFRAPDATAETVKSLTERLSRQFSDAQYFSNHHEVGLYVWARARRGQLVRGYGWLGSEGRTFWTEGKETKEERDLGFPAVVGQPPPTDGGDGGDKALLPEDVLFQLACYWSIDPTTLDGEYYEPVTGLLGTIAR